MRLRRLIISALILALATGTADAAQKLTMNFTTGESATAFIAKDEGFFAKHGLDVDLVPVTQNSNAPAALASGSVQIGMIQVANLLQGADSGLDFVALAGGAGNEKNVTKFAVVVRSGLDVKDAKGLIGKKVGVPGIGASIDIFFRNWLLNNDVDPGKVSIAETTFLAMADNMKNGNVDAVTPLEPFITRITSQKIGYELYNLVNMLPRPMINALLFVSTRDWATENAATIPELRAAIVEADTFIRANPDKSRAAINKYTQVPMPILESLPVPAVDAEVRKDDLDFWAGMMERLHMLQNKPDTAKLIWK
ncbi:MAG TPA: ABC transporter substrate-binding protein [Stellaceae bacterium]|jgi:NitT/TauT family transport system substrate-binding protein|nr:ABC transporter substrate-binding protein [Stellaceae bacterium]